MRISRKEWLVYIGVSLLSVGLVYAVSTENVDLKLLRATARVCQGTARIFGTLGLEAERAYLSILETGRLV